MELKTTTARKATDLQIILSEAKKLSKRKLSTAIREQRNEIQRMKNLRDNFKSKREDLKSVNRTIKFGIMRLCALQDHQANILNL